MREEIEKCLMTFIDRRCSLRHRLAHLRNSNSLGHEIEFEFRKNIEFEFEPATLALTQLQLSIELQLRISLDFRSNKRVGISIISFMHDTRFFGRRGFRQLTERSRKNSVKPRKPFLIELHKRKFHSQKYILDTLKSM